MTPLLAPLTVAVPLANVIVVATPKLTAVPVLLLTVGTVPFGELLAPPKVRLLSPAYVGAVFPNASTAVIVRLSATPAVGVVDAAANDRLAADAGDTVTDSPVPLLMVPSVTVM